MVKPYETARLIVAFWLMQTFLYIFYYSQVVFEAALLRTGYQGDIAIDDFRVTDGKCVRPTRDASQIGPQRRTTTTAEPDYNGGAT